MLAERRNLVTRPGKGNDWKRGAKAGFTGVISFGRVICDSPTLHGVKNSDWCCCQCATHPHANKSRPIWQQPQNRSEPSPTLRSHENNHCHVRCKRAPELSTRCSQAQGRRERRRMTVHTCRHPNSWRQLALTSLRSRCSPLSSRQRSRLKVQPPRLRRMERIVS